MNTIKLSLVVGLTGLLAQGASASPISLVGTELRLNGLIQATPGSEPSTFAAEVSATVSDTEVEYPNVNDFGITDTTVPGFPTPITTVPVSIDAGADFLAIDFDNTAPFNFFVPAYENTYIFTFADDIAPLITSAVIDSEVTTLGLQDEDLSFSGNQLFVNVEGLSFNTSTFAKIDLTAVSAPSAVIPLPGALPLMLVGLAGFSLVRQRGRGVSSNTAD